MCNCVLEHNNDEWPSVCQCVVLCLSPYASPIFSLSTSLCRCFFLPLPLLPLSIYLSLSLLLFSPPPPLSLSLSLSFSLHHTILMHSSPPPPPPHTHTHLDLCPSGTLLCHTDKFYLMPNQTCHPSFPCTFIYFLITYEPNDKIVSVSLILSVSVTCLKHQQVLIMPCSSRMSTVISRNNFSIFVKFCV